MLDSAPCSSRGRHSGIVRGTRWIKEMEKDSLEASEYVGDAATAMYFMVFLQVIHSISDPSLVRTSRSLSGREGDFPFPCAITVPTFLFRTCGYCHRQQRP